MRHRITLAFVLTVAACSAGSTPSADDTSTTTAPTTTTTSTSTTTTLPTTTTTTEPPAPVALPNTWIGVTDDYEAVEVDTATGEILTSIAQVSTAEDVETAECAACVNAVDAVWRSYDGSYFYVSECCEPAAGAIRVLTPEMLPYLPGDDVHPWFFWSAAPSPNSDQVVFVGYQVVITEASVDPRAARPGADYTVVWTHTGDVFPMSNAVWDDDRILWLESSPDHVVLRTHTGDTTTAVDVPDLDAWSSAILTRQGPGRFVVAPSPFAEFATEAVVIDDSGAVVDRFAIERGSLLGSYDSTGTYLIYVDGEGVVRWLGDGDSGVLAEGFIQANW